MNVKTFRKIKLGLFLILALSVVGSFYTPHSFLTFLGIGFYLALVSLVKTSVDGVIADERQMMVSEKASQISFRILMPILALTTTALLMAGGKEEFYYIRALGIVLAYVTCLGLIIYVLTYGYFNKKTGGR